MGSTGLYNGTSWLPSGRSLLGQGAARAERSRRGSLPHLATFETRFDLRVPELEAPIQHQTPGCPTLPGLGLTAHHPSFAGRKPAGGSPPSPLFSSLARELSSLAVAEGVTAALRRYATALGLSSLPARSRVFFTRWATQGSAAAPGRRRDEPGAQQEHLRSRLKFLDFLAVSGL